MRKTRTKTTRLPDLEWHRRVGVAGQQIDAEPGGRFGWLVRFVREDPARWLPGDQEAHGYRLLAFLRSRPGKDRYITLLDRIAPLTRSEVAALHAELGAFLRACVTVAARQEVEVPTDGVRMVVIRRSDPGEKPAPFVRSWHGPFRTKLFQAVSEWLVDTDRLLACPTCGEPFLALRKRLFCSPACLQTHHDRKKIAKRKMEKAKSKKGGDA